MTEPRRPPRFGRVIGTSFRTAFRADRRLALALIVVAVVQVNSAVIAGVLLKVIVSGASRGDDPAVATGALFFGLVAAGLFVLRVARGRITSIVTDRTAAEFDAMTMRLTGQVTGIEHFETPEYLDRLEIIRHQPTALGQSFAVLVNAAALIVQGVVVIGLLIFLHPVLLVLPLLAVPGFWAMKKGLRTAADAFDETAETRRLSGRLFGLGTDLSAAAEIRLSGLGQEVVDRHDSAWHRMSSRIRRAEYAASAVQGAGRLLFIGGYVGAIALILDRGLRGQASPGDVLLTLVLAGVINQQIWTILDVVRRSMFVTVVMVRFCWLADFARDHGTEAGAIGQPPAGLREGITLRDVSFRYPGGDSDVLRHVDLHLPAGSVVALVGENGAGKTSLVKLLTAMYPVSGGEIMVDRTPLARIDPAAWRARTTAAFQDFCRFEFTLGTSIGIGDLRHLDDRPAIRAALDRVGGTSLPDSLGQDLDTPLGESFIDGTRLSGGQWQLVALGRAMMRPAPLLLVLDEPTASLDPEAENELFERHARLARAAARETGGVTLLISHRFSSVRAADLVVVLAEGAVTETGTHRELVQAGGAYAEWFHTQARAYG